MKLSANWRRLFIAVAALPVLTACVATVSVPVARVGYQQPVYQQPAPVYQQQMPAPLAETIPQQPVNTATWVRGYWYWSASGWVWQPGFWSDGQVATMPAPVTEVVTVAPNPALFWIAGHYVFHRGIGWRWSNGHWAPRHHQHRR